MAITRKEIEDIGFIPLGSGWFKDEWDSYRIRKWVANEIDIWHWGCDESLHETIFRGRLNDIHELLWVLGRVTESNVI